MENMKVEILSREFVKPSSPTPNHLRDYKLCLLDQFHPEFHGGIIFFYTCPTKTTIDNIKTNLKKSLSETLTEFYPIAGRFKNTSTIDCNDDGACFIAAKISSDLSDFLSGLNAASDVHNSLRKLVPSLDSATMELASESMLIAQLTEFNCGGLAIAFSLQHRFCDFSSVVTLLRRWSARARSDQNPSQTDPRAPDFSAASSLLPPRLDAPAPPLPAATNPPETLATRRLVFAAAKIAELKSAARSLTLNLSRVEAVVALLVKTAVAAAAGPSPALLFHAADLRRRTAPPLPETAVGNLFWMIPVRIEPNRTAFTPIAAAIKTETAAFFEKLGGSGDDVAAVLAAARERGERMREGVSELDVYLCSSWCRFGLYEVDFGWGAPVWVSSGVVLVRNLIVLEDTKCGTGIQAWVTLDPRVMDVFERDRDLLSYASLTDSVHDLFVN